MGILWLLRVLLLVIALAACGAPRAQSTFRISEVFSNLDGSIQFVALTEMAGLDGQQHFKGLSLTITHAGVVKQLTFDHDLATDRTAHLSIVVAATLGGRIADNTGHFIAFSVPDFLVPARFVSADGGTVDFAGLDQVTYPALPADGSTAWYRDGAFAQAKLPGLLACDLTSSGSCPGAINPTPTRVETVEYYNAALDHYFITASAAEIDALDSGRLAGWRRTGESLWFGEVARTAQDLEYTYQGGPVCRFYLPPGRGDSHFFSATADECLAVRARYPSFIEESSAAFYAAAPDLASGECGVMPGFIDGDIQMLPVYRLWNQRADTNHRYTMSSAIRDAMIARGWLPEGYGPLGVALCL